MRRLSLLIGFAVLLSVGCAPRIYYHIGLLQVEKPLEAKERYGASEIIKFETEEANKYSFEDELVKVVWFPPGDVLPFTLTNKTTHSIKLIWDEASYVDEYGVNHRVVHAGTRYVDRSKAQPPSVIARGATLTDLVYPSDYTYWEAKGRGLWGAGKPIGWVEKPLFPTSIYNAEELAEAHRGKTFQVLFPLEVEGVVNEYIFLFKIQDVEIK